MQLTHTHTPISNCTTTIDYSLEPAEFIGLAFGYYSLVFNFLECIRFGTLDTTQELIWLRSIRNQIHVKDQLSFQPTKTLHVWGLDGFPYITDSKVKYSALP